MAHAHPPTFTYFLGFTRWPMNQQQGSAAAAAVGSGSHYYANAASNNTTTIQSPNVISRTPPSTPLPIFQVSSSSPPINFSPVCCQSHLQTHQHQHSRDGGVLLHVVAQKHAEMCGDLNDAKVAFKDFSKMFRLKQKEGEWRNAYIFGIESFDKYPARFHWKICLELADLAKRKNLIDVARFWYHQVNLLQPFAAPGWVEHAKLEEEYGDLNRCREIIKHGLLFVPHHETLMVKILKLEEKTDNIQAARVILSQLQGIPGDKAYKTIFEGALMESRAGNILAARNILRYLMFHMRWYGPVYHAAFSLEEKHGHYRNARTIIERGLAEIPRYGPLWFGAFRLYEKIGVKDEVLRNAIQMAAGVISKELIWKVYFEASQIEERRGSFDKARQDYVQSVKYCPKNLKWKVWLGGARMELRAGNLYAARLLLNRSMEEVPQKTRAMVLLECARLEEFAGNIQRAREILTRARSETCYEWKVFLESVLLEIRCGDMTAALSAAQQALEIHSGTGRLWAVLIQLKQLEGQEEQLRVFKQAYQEVPKSGEVWCEGARIHLDPTSTHFCLTTARRYLEFAVKFTPQYGDSFVELLRLEMLEHGVDYVPDDLVKQCVNADPNYGAMWFQCKESVLDTALEVLIRAKSLVLREIYDNRSLYQRAMLNDWDFSSRDAALLKARSEWQQRNMNSLELLYPCAGSLCPADRHRMLFGSSASFHD
eukprot:TRINITY_DN1462_c0_g1_i1.p1 TRINITY_DN1462_c0_g1~~TRINITY_DN1462_c0_g1_i1.p1  ORF type:complete len:711 (+),score=160.98 TRINITY_DN1462_c0_g1_i1:193-2325(+)